MRTIVLILSSALVAVSCVVGGCSTNGDTGPQVDASTPDAGDAPTQGHNDSGGGAGLEAGPGNASVPADTGLTTDGAVAGDGGGSSDSTTVPDAHLGGDASADPDFACYGAGLAAVPCTQCCDQRHPGGSTMYNTAFDDCFCSPPNGITGLCQTPCAQSDCSSMADAAPSVTGDPCDLCEQQQLADGGTCRMQINAACQSSTDCVLYEQCIGQCP